MPLSIQRGPLTTGSQTTEPVSASSFVTRRTVRGSTSRRSATCTFFIRFRVCRVIMSSLIATGMCRLFPGDMAVAGMDGGSHVPPLMTGHRPTRPQPDTMSPRGTELQYHQKVNKRIGAVSCGKRSIETQIAVFPFISERVLWYAPKAQRLAPKKENFSSTN